MPDEPPDEDEPYTGVGSLQYALIHDTDALLAEQYPSVTMPLYTTQDHTTPVYVRNGNNWAAEHVQALTAISPWNSEGVFQKAGTLISPRHAIFATHYYPSIGSTLRWVAADNSVETRELTGFVTVGTDLLIGVLDSDLPSSISFAKVLPAGFKSRLSTNLAAARIPVLATDQEEKLIVVDLHSVDHDNAEGESCLMQRPVSALRASFTELLVGGDSGNPAFWIINGDMVMLTVWRSSSGGGYGISIPAYTAEINAAMTTLGGGYQLTEADLSGFATEP
jgi:hypothetical protein